MVGESRLIDWLLEGDVCVQYQTKRDLLGAGKQELDALQMRIPLEGFGAEYLKNRSSWGGWGRSFYQPKWTCSHYTLLEMRNIGFPQDCSEAKAEVSRILRGEKNGSGSIMDDVCINGMVLGYACYFGADEDDLKSIVDYILAEMMPDGGFNCRRARKGALHSSLHSTICVAEGIAEYKKQGYTYRLGGLLGAQETSQEFMLQHKLYRSDHTGEVIDKKMLMLSYPPRWRYDILRALDYLRAAGRAYDGRMDDALEALKGKMRKDGAWPTQSRQPGEVFFETETAGKSGRWNTLRALRVLKAYDGDKVT